MNNFYVVTLMLIVNPVAFCFPLSTEDTGTLAQGRSKIELNSERGEDYMSNAREVSSSHEITIIHGLWDSFNGFINLPYRDVSTQEADGSINNFRGLGDAKIGMKWRYFELDGLSLGLKSGVTAPTGDTTRKMGKGQATYGFNAIASYKIELLEYHINLGYTWLPSTGNQRELIESISTAVALNLNSRWKVIADIGVAGNKSKASNDTPAYVGAGFKFKINPSFALEMGVKHGLTPSEIDNTVLVGINQIFN